MEYPEEFEEESETLPTYDDMMKFLTIMEEEKERLEEEKERQKGLTNFVKLIGSLSKTNTEQLSNALDFLIQDMVDVNLKINDFMFRQTNQVFSPYFSQYLNQLDKQTTIVKNTKKEIDKLDPSSFDESLKNKIETLDKKSRKLIKEGETKLEHAYDFLIRYRENILVKLNWLQNLDFKNQYKYHLQIFEKIIGHLETVLYLDEERYQIISALKNYKFIEGVDKLLDQVFESNKKLIQETNKYGFSDTVYESLLPKIEKQFNQFYDQFTENENTWYEMMKIYIKSFQSILKKYFDVYPDPNLEKKLNVMLNTLSDTSRSVVFKKRQDSEKYYMTFNSLLKKLEQMILSIPLVN